MDKEFEGVFELFEIRVRRLRNGNKIALIFEVAEDLEVEKELIEFRGENVKAIITQAIEPQHQLDVVTIEGEFEVFDLKVRRLRNGDKLRLILEQIYKKETEVESVKLRFNDCKIFFSSIEQRLDFEADDDEVEDGQELDFEGEQDVDFEGENERY